MENKIDCMVIADLKKKIEQGGASSSQGIDYERLSSMMSEKISQTKLYVAVTDINAGQRKYARISDMAKL